MLQHFHKFAVILFVLVVCMVTLVGGGAADDLTVRLIVNPSKTEVFLGTDPIALTARAKGKNLTYEWKILGPGSLEGTGSSVFYVLPDEIEGGSALALITVKVTDETGQEISESVTLNILPEAVPAATPTVTPTPEAEQGMSKTTKIALGAGAVAAIGGGIALAAGSGDGDDTNDDNDAGGACGGVRVGGYCWYLALEQTGCDVVCATHGFYDDEGTRTYAGSDGTDENCWRVLEALGAPADTDVTLTDTTANIGCYVNCSETDSGTVVYWKRGLTFTVSGAAYPDRRRACACSE